jgi:hypothetical protein
LWVLLGAAATALICWIALPGTALDRAAFNSVVRGFVNPPWFISGSGTQTAPWTLRTFASKVQPDQAQAPVIVSLGDDPDGFFQSFPPSPIDLAVILSNFQRLGMKNAASAAVLAWESPDPMGLAALDQALARFDSLVMAAPLSRAPVAAPMPQAFRQASVPLESIHGDPTGLPIVNHIPLPGLILGKDNTRAGFQALDSESVSELPPLLARWDDRVVFAFPVLCVLQRFGLPVSGVEIHLGEFLKLGSNGPIVPIDRFGRFALPLKSLASSTNIPASALIDGDSTLFPKNAAPPVVLRDDRSAVDPSTRAFSQQVPALIAAIAADAGLTPAREVPRLQTAAELLWLLIAILVLTAISNLPVFSRSIGFLTIIGVSLGAQFLALGAAHLWLPGLPVLAATAWAWALSSIIVLPPAKPLPGPVKPLPPRPVHSSVPPAAAP